MENDNSGTPVTNTDKPSLKLLSLKFTGEDKDLEDHYYDDYFYKSLIPVRFALLFALFFYSAFGILDIIYAPDVYRKVWIIRFGFVAPVLLVVLGMTFMPFFRKGMQIILAATSVVAGGGVLAIMVITPAPRGSAVYTGLILVMIYIYTILRLRFVWASLAGWLLLIGYEIVGIWMIDAPGVVFISNNFFCLSANFIGMLACYIIEHQFRRDYYFTRKYEVQRLAAESANVKLTKTVGELQEALDNIKVLKGLIPICASCKKIRDDQGFWHRVEKYLAEHSKATFTHGICPECEEKLYGDFLRSENDINSIKFD